MHICIPEMRTSGHMHHPWSQLVHRKVYKTTPEDRPAILQTLNSMYIRHTAHNKRAYLISCMGGA